MIVVCGRHWQREHLGLGKSLSTFAVSFGVVAVYYGLLVVWFWHLVPVAAAGNEYRSPWKQVSDPGGSGNPSLAPGDFSVILSRFFLPSEEEVLAYRGVCVYFSTAQLLS